MNENFIISANLGYTTEDPDLFCAINNFPIVGTFTEPSEAIENIRQLCEETRRILNQGFPKDLMLYLNIYNNKLSTYHEYSIKVIALKTISQ